MACDYLEEKGFKILSRNWHFSNRGELDLVAIDPSRFGKEYLVFIEVKSRDASMTASLEALSHGKRRQLRKLASAYLKHKKINSDTVNISFDFIAIHRDKIEHVQDVQL
jgi:putative endonuclease